MTFEIRAVLDPMLLRNELPSEIRFRDFGWSSRRTTDPRDAVTSAFALSRELGLFGLLTGFYETYRPDIEREHGVPPSTWPPVWAFARAVRNAGAHGGRLHFRGATLAANQAVGWKSLTYVPMDDQDRRIMWVDFAEAEFVTLLEEMDEVLPR